MQVIIKLKQGHRVLQRETTTINLLVVNLWGRLPYIEVLGIKRDLEHGKTVSGLKLPNGTHFLIKPLRQ